MLLHHDYRNPTLHYSLKHAFKPVTVKISFSITCCVTCFKHLRIHIWKHLAKVEVQTPSLVLQLLVHCLQNGKLTSDFLSSLSSASGIVSSTSAKNVFLRIVRESAAAIFLFHSHLSSCIFNESFLLFIHTKVVLNVLFVDYPIISQHIHCWSLMQHVCSISHVRSNTRTFWWKEGQTFHNCIIFPSSLISHT